MNLRLATMADAQSLYDWRNDPETRQASHNTAEIAYEEHVQWLSKTLENPRRRIYIAEVEGKPVGTVRLDDVHSATEMSWTVAPAHRRRGIGKQMVAMASELVDGPAYAEIKASNTASFKIAQRAGMALHRAADGVLYYSR